MAATTSEPRKPTLLFTDEAMLAHQPGPGHPERPERLAALIDDFAARPVPGVTQVRPRAATREELQLVHT